MPAVLARAAAALLALALLVPATGAGATTRHRKTAKHHTTTHHATTHHPASHHQTRKADKTDRHHKTKPAEHHDLAPAGAMGVPGGGLKLFCPARKNPLLIRKATQGAGTTVTVVCR